MQSNRIDQNEATNARHWGKGDQNCLKINWLHSKECKLEQVHIICLSFNNYFKFEAPLLTRNFLRLSFHLLWVFQIHSLLIHSVSVRALPAYNLMFSGFIRIHILEVLVLCYSMLINHHGSVNEWSKRKLATTILIRMAWIYWINFIEGAKILNKKE